MTSQQNVCRLEVGTNCDHQLTKALLFHLLNTPSKPHNFTLMYEWQLVKHSCSKQDVKKWKYSKPASNLIYFSKLQSPLSSSSIRSRSSIVAEAVTTLNERKQWQQIAALHIHIPTPNMDSKSHTQRTNSFNVAFITESHNQLILMLEDTSYSIDQPPTQSLTCSTNASCCLMRNTVTPWTICFSEFFIRAATLSITTISAMNYIRNKSWCTT